MTTRRPALAWFAFAGAVFTAQLVHAACPGADAMTTASTSWGRV